MTKQFCDKCGRDITNVDSSTVHGILGADQEGNGTVTTTADLCRPCYRRFLRWIAERAPR